MNPILLPRKERNASAEWARNVRESVTSPKSPDLGRDDLRGNATINQGEPQPPTTGVADGKNV